MYVFQQRLMKKGKQSTKTPQNKMKKPTNKIYDINSIQEAYPWLQISCEKLKYLRKHLGDSLQNFAICLLEPWYDKMEWYIGI